MYLFVLLIALGVGVTHGNPKTAKGLDFIGVGYNLLKGNPDGGDLSNGGVDPGLLFTQKIFKLTWNTKRLSTDREYSVPDQVVFDHRSSCRKTIKEEFFSGTKSYQDKLKVDVQAAGDVDTALWKYAFSLSTGYKKVDEQTSKNRKVFYEKKAVCNNGRARYQLALTQQKNFSVTEEFAASVCNLPQTYNKMAYFRFIEKWGTHVVKEVQLGTRTTERYESSYVEFFKYAMKNVGSAVSVSSSYRGHSASLSVDIKMFGASMTNGSSFGENKVVFTSGGPDMPEPIGLKLLPIDTLFRTNWQYQCKRLAQRKENVKRLLKEYPALKGATTFKAEIRKRHLGHLMWPLGKYGLPMPKCGCPGPSDIWQSGWRYHDTEDTSPNNHWSNPYDLAGSYGKNNMKQVFCIKIKHRTSRYNRRWPRGKYCIFKKGNCPAGFNHHSRVIWDDEDSGNQNDDGGKLPDGQYDRNTKIEYCCRTDGYASVPITLPTVSPFVLITTSSKQCQRVKGMDEKAEYFYWDNEDKSPISEIQGNVVGAELLGRNKNIKVHYCFYKKRYWLG